MNTVTTRLSTPIANECWERPSISSRCRCSWITSNAAFMPIRSAWAKDVLRWTVRGGGWSSGWQHPTTCQRGNACVGVAHIGKPQTWFPHRSFNSVCGSTAQAPSPLSDFTVELKLARLTPSSHSANCSRHDGSLNSQVALSSASVV